MIVKDGLMLRYLASFDIRASPCRCLRVTTLEMLVEFDHIVLHVVIEIIKIFDYPVSPNGFGVSPCCTIK